jgi:hypothetical protein
MPLRPRLHPTLFALQIQNGMDRSTADEITLSDPFPSNLESRLRHEMGNPMMSERHAIPPLAAHAVLPPTLSFQQQR